MKRVEIKSLGPFWTKLQCEVTPCFPQDMKESLPKLILSKSPSEAGVRLKGSNPRQLFFEKVQYKFFGVYDAFKQLLLTEHFVNEIPEYQADSDIISYHAEKHLLDINILRERIKVLLGLIEKKLKNNGLSNEYKTVNALCAATFKVLQQVSATRGSHVHKERFSNPERALLVALDLCVDEWGMEDLRPERERAACEYLRKWREVIGQNNENMKKILYQLFNELTPIVFDRLAPLLGAPPTENGN